MPRHFIWLGLLMLLFLNQVSAVAENIPYNQDQILNKINTIRQNKNLPNLNFNPWLNLSAQNKALDMKINKYFSHNSPDNVKFSDWPKSAGYQYSVIGENLAFGYQNLDQAITAWVNSPTHLANILDPLYQDTGLAITRIEVRGQSGWLIVQEFGRPLTKTTAENYLPFQQKNSSVNQLQGLV